MTMRADRPRGEETPFRDSFEPSQDLDYTDSNSDFQKSSCAHNGIISNRRFPLIVQVDAACRIITRR